MSFEGVEPSALGSPEGPGAAVASRSTAKHASFVVQSPAEAFQEQQFVPERASNAVGGPSAPSPLPPRALPALAGSGSQRASRKTLQVQGLQSAEPLDVTHIPNFVPPSDEIGPHGSFERRHASDAHPLAVSYQDPVEDAAGCVDVASSSGYASANFESATINVLGAIHHTPKGQAAVSFKGLDLSAATERPANSSESLAIDVEAQKIVIIGSGWLGRALAKRLVAAGRKVIIGARDPERFAGPDSASKTRGAFGLPCPAMHIGAALAQMDQILILAIPHTAHASFAGKYVECFKEDTVIVDVSNTEEPGVALALQKLLLHGSVVKAFNTVSAYALEQVGQMSNPVMMSGAPKAKQVVRQSICEPLGFNAIDLGDLESSKIQEQIPMQFFSKWKLCVGISTFIFAAWFLYCMLWYVVWPVPHKFDGSKSGTPYYKPSTFSLSIMNKVFALTGFTLFGLTYLPGVLAGVIQLYRGTAKVPFPALLGQWMNLRKQLGLAAVWFIVNHAFMSAIRLSRDYAEFPLFMHPEDDKGANTMTWPGEACMVFGIISFSVFLVLMATSVPSIGQTLSYKEWMFVQSTLGGLGLLLGFVHVFMYQTAFWVCGGGGCADWLKTWPQNALPPYTLSLFIPGFVLLLRLILGMPGIYGRLMNIRKGM